MIILEKQQPTDGELSGLPLTVGDSHTHHHYNKSQSRRERRRYRGRRFRKSLKVLLHCVSLTILFWGLKNFTHGQLPWARMDRDRMVEAQKGHHGGVPGLSPHRVAMKEREELFLSIPDSESARAASKAYASHPHLAGSPEDFDDAKVILKLFQTELGIATPSSEPIFSAGTPDSRNATLGLTSVNRSSTPSAWIDVYYPYLDTPLDRSLEILGEDGNAVWTADLVEDGDPLDEDAHKYRDAIKAWHGYSAHGEAEGQLVYANYGTHEDYEDLVASGADLTGKIVIVRYGGIFRGLKIKGAEELGAAGVLIYSDPRDDGYVTVQNGFLPYPAGPARNPTSIQRGSVMDISKYPGDPTTPGYPAYEGAERTETANIPNIPSLPVSWQNAERLLEEIGDVYLKGVQNDGRKRLSGKMSATKIKLVNHVDAKITPIWNAMASIPGHIKDEVVLIGCHRDAWVLGGADPVSGTVSLHEVVRGFGALLKKGWKPLRTVVFASWDAEEHGLVGSTEYGEDFGPWISEHVVSYLNVDVSVAGSRWTAAGSPSLSDLIKESALDVPHPTIPGKTLWDAQKDDGPFNADGFNGTMSADVDFMRDYEAGEKTKESLASNVTPLGSGSDFTVFLQRLGVSSTDQSFAATPNDAVYHYHPIYDSHRWQDTYADPGFSRHVAVAKHLGLMALRLTDSIIVPLNTTQYALQLDDYLDEVENLASNVWNGNSSESIDFSPLRESISTLQSASIELDAEKDEAEKAFEELLSQLPYRRGNCKRRSGFMRRVTGWVKSIFGVGPHRHHTHSDRKAEVWMDYLKFDAEDELPSAFSQESMRASSLEHGHEHGHEHGPEHSRPPFPIRKFIKAAKRVARVNKKLISFERGFISEDGIKDREWYKHLGVAPGKWLGYGATTLPALSEAITIDNNATLAGYEVHRLRKLTDTLAKVIRP